MRIIKYGTKKLKLKRFTCPYCGSIFDAGRGGINGWQKDTIG